MSYYSSEPGLLTENLLTGAPGAESREVANTTARPLMVLPRPPVCAPCLPRGTSPALSGLYLPGSHFQDNFCIPAAPLA